MNVPMQDAFNLCWKLAAVLRGRSGPELLRTYSDERQAVARELIDFDREWTRLLSAPPKDPADAASPGVEPAEFRRRFTASGRHTAGVATRYRSSMVTGAAASQYLATGLTVGMRFHSAPVVRLADGRPMQLGHVAEADGRWRIYVFADASGIQRGSRAARALEYLADGRRSPIARCALAGADVDSVIDVRLVISAGHREVCLEDLPALALPRKGALGLIDYEKAFCADPGPGRDIYALRGIDRALGCLVVARPDQYVAEVLSPDERGQLDAFLSGSLLPVDPAPRSSSQNKSSRGPNGRGLLPAVPWHRQGTSASAVRLSRDGGAVSRRHRAAGSWQEPAARRDVFSLPFLPGLLSELARRRTRAVVALRAGHAGSWGRRRSGRG